MALAQPTPKETLGDKVAAFSKMQIGEKVGDGECAALAHEALKSAGAKTSAGPDSPDDGDYVWGELVFTLEITLNAPKATGKIEAIKPGDIVQFRDTKWVTVSGNRTSTMTATHHTAVVAAVDMANARLPIYQQNSNGNRYVTEDVLRLNDLKEGWIRVYRPVAGDAKP